jgi:hypothetical protein
MQNSKFTIQKWSLVFCIFNFAFLIGGCGIPNLEKPECAQARDAAKQFYSFHFGNDMRPSPENLKLRERFLTPRYYTMLAAAGEITTDQFTMTEEHPKTFKIGECKANTPTNIDLQLQLYWRDDQKTVQQEVVANMVKENGKWLLDGVGSKKR